MRLGQLLAGGLTPNEAHGVVALISSMRMDWQRDDEDGSCRRDGENLPFRRRRWMEPKRFRGDGRFTQGVPMAGEMSMPKKVFCIARMRSLECQELCRRRQWELEALRALRTEVKEPMTPEEGSESPGIPVVETSPCEDGEN